jgi:hypothetical protein
MPLYELSIDPGLVREAERVVSLDGRGFPTLVMRWDSRLFEKPWQTTLVLDYAIALPPLVVGQSTFNEVKVAAFVGGARTKFLYFGTEMSASVPRLGPEMENSVAPSGQYQEFRIEEATCPLPYLKLIQATPRIYGNGAQDYYSPPIKVERYDGATSPDLLADFFGTLTAGFAPVGGAVLTDPGRGIWTGARYVGVTEIAILRQGKVVGLHRRLGSASRDSASRDSAAQDAGAKHLMPAEIKQRDPKLDIARAWVGIDLGAATTTVALRADKGQAELLRIGATGPVTHASDQETPSEICFVNLAATLKAWRERVVLPLTRWDSVLVGHAAKAERLRQGPEALPRAAATLTALPLLRERIERKERITIRGGDDPATSEALKRPAPPVIDEDGIGAHDPFDPLELFAYYVGLTVNQRLRGVHLRYSIAMPAGLTGERRASALVAFRRGLYRSLPDGLVEYHDQEQLEVLDAGPSVVPLAAQAFRIFNIQPRDEAIPFAIVDAGASETSFLFGVLRPADMVERTAGFDRMMEHDEPHVIPWLGGERLLHRLAYRAYLHAAAAMREAGIPIDRPSEEQALSEGTAHLVSDGPEARANVTTLKDALRPLLERGAGVKMPTKLQLFGGGGPREVAISFDAAALGQAIEGFLAEGAAAFLEALGAAVLKIGKGKDRYAGLHVILGGRMGLHPSFADVIARGLSPSAQLHRFREPDKTHLTAPTVKTATALGVLAMRLDHIGAKLRDEGHDGFRYRVGRNRHGQFVDALDATAEAGAWREVGACTKPEVEVLFTSADEDSDLVSDDPRVSRVVCALGPSAMGKRLYMRVVSATRVEVSVGPSSAGPEPGAPCWAVNLRASVARPV